jgi:hypothetical protein
MSAPRATAPVGGVPEERVVLPNTAAPEQAEEEDKQREAFKRFLDRLPRVKKKKKKGQIRNENQNKGLRFFRDFARKKWPRSGAVRSKSSIGFPR